VKRAALVRLAFANGNVIYSAYHSSQRRVLFRRPARRALVAAWFGCPTDGPKELE
jgi:hypothetical protein